MRKETTAASKIRIGRIEFIASMSFWFLLTTLLSAILYTRSEIVWQFPHLLFLIIFSFVAIKRLHDFNYRGWWVVPCLVVQTVIDMYFIPLAAVIALALIPGSKNKNHFGHRRRQIRKEYRWLLLVSLIVGGIFLSLEDIPQSLLPFKSRFSVQSAWKHQNGIVYTIQYPVNTAASSLIVEYSSMAYRHTLPHYFLSSRYFVSGGSLFQQYAQERLKSETPNTMATLSSAYFFQLFKNDHFLSSTGIDFANDNQIVLYDREVIYKGMPIRAIGVTTAPKKDTTLQIKAMHYKIRVIRNNNLVFILNYARPSFSKAKFKLTSLYLPYRLVERVLEKYQFFDAQAVYFFNSFKPVRG